MKGFWGTFFIFLLWATAGIYYIHFKENKDIPAKDSERILMTKQDAFISNTDTYAFTSEKKEIKSDTATIDSNSLKIELNASEVDSASNNVGDMDLDTLSKSPKSTTSNTNLYISENTTVDSQLLADEIKKSIAISDTVDINKDEPTIEYRGETVVKKNPNVASQIFYPGYANTDLIVGNDLIAYATELKKILAENPTKKVTIIGHTDNVGNAKDNFMIGLKKSRQIKWYLTTRRGIERSRVTAISRGESSPIESNASVWGRKKNNRIEIIIH